ncbi:G-type lectin S-receptor-like serine/threonine-protein kinase At2g19130 isoform X2 [Miscanthus floridulus]|uniref:G-type lectin S-receptor-like serine/threonine-protein kinase At2g19130 isoform X2 n=1 Tax=Miscanthus floridulus TaxID=154761 RepID=UPI0034579A89
MSPLYVTLLGLIFFSSLHAPSSAATAIGDTLTAGQALAAGDKLVSRNGKFALGFFQFKQRLNRSRTAGESTTTITTVVSSPGWYLGIWFNKIPVFTPVWVANREGPITESELKVAQLKISRDGNLVITLNNTNTKSTVWSSTAVNSTNSTVVSAVLMGTGNLALVTKNTSSAVPLWQSFDYPTDVGLPGAKFGRNKKTGLNRFGISKKSLIDPDFGSYSIEVDINGQILLTGRKPPYVVYWSWTAGKLGELVQVLNGLMDSDPRTKGLLKPTFQENNEEVYFSYTLIDESASVFVPIDVFGQLQLNIWSNTTKSWETVYAQPSDYCIASAVCGPFTVCNGNSRPNYCDCMETFSLKSPRDWDLGDQTGGCARNSPLDCISSNKSKTSSTDVFHPIPSVTLPYDAQVIEGVATQSNCAEACLNDCSCTAYAYSNSKCSVWLGELRNVNQDDGNGISSQDVLYLRLAARDLQSLKEKSKRIPRPVISASIVGGLVLLMLMLLFFMIWRNKFKMSNAALHGTGGSGGIVAFRYIDLSRATKNFSQRLGRGGFGSVFKGAFSDLTTIAVKRLDGARQGDKQFRAESNGPILNWSTRYQIATGVARGLCYLHQSCRECIIHCDIKPENILLDASFVPKIADFGMAAFVGRDFSRVLTTFRGTAGYLAPEWLSGIPITPKVDVYSFGMVLLELISGKRNTPEVNSKSSHHVFYFPVEAISKLHEGDLQSLVDPQLQGDLDLEEAERICKIAFWCIQDNECDRPTMGEVVWVLEGLHELDMPPMPRLLAAIMERYDDASM